MNSRRIVALCVILSTIGCVNLRQRDRETLRDIERYDLNPTEIQIKNAGLAGGLGIISPVCNWYLAYGTHQTDQILVGFLNLLTWPLSVIWAIPQCAADALTLNKLETIDYYEDDRDGIREFAAARERYEGSHRDEE